MIVNPSRTIVWVMLTRTLSALSQAVALFLLARSIPQNEFGFFASFLSVILFLAVACEFGTDSYSVRALAQKRHARVATASRLHLLLAAGFACLAAFGSLAASGPFPSMRGLALIPVYVLVERRLSFTLGLFTAAGHANFGTWALLGARTVTLTSFFIAVRAHALDPRYAFAVSGIVGGMIGLFALRRFFTLASASRLRSPTYREVLRDSFALYTATMSGQLRTLDVPLVALIGGPAAAAIYALPARAVAPLRLVGTSIASVAFPLAAHGDTTKLRRLNKSVYALSTIAAAAAVAAWPWMPKIVEWVMGSAYAGSGAVLRVFLLGIALNVIGSLYSSELQGFGDQAFVALMGIGLVFVFYLALAIGVSADGAIGASWGLTGAFAAQVVVTAIRLRRKNYLT